MEWMGIVKDPIEWGWCRKARRLEPIKMSRDAAPPNLLKTISCRCTTGCMGACGCRKAVLKCSALCKFCAGQECNNRIEVIVDDEDDADLVTSLVDENEELDFINSPPKKRAKRTCFPNTHILLNDKLCLCDSQGTWRESNCHSIATAGRRQTCLPGHVVIQGCNRCVCQSNGQYSCVDQGCASGQLSAHENLAKALPWCNPFRTYYIDCNICVCPASGKTTDARCALDASCTFFGELSAVEVVERKTRCMPKVMYLFSCIHCLCSDDGLFSMKKCFVTCTKKKLDTTTRRCIPKTLYRRGCNICVCPDSSIPDDIHCTNRTCDAPTSSNLLRTLKHRHINCNPYEFLKPRCVYCECNQEGGIDEKTCLDLECLQNEDLKYDVPRESCSPGEMVPFCMECLCTKSGTTSDDYCSKACSYQSKLKVLDRIIAMANFNSVIDKEVITRNSDSDICTPNSIYADIDRICICPETGITNFSLCTASVNHVTSVTGVKLHFNGTCEPNTFIEFDCNTCFCSKNGKIDPKWCTYDDCEAKRIIQESHKKNSSESEVKTETSLPNTCNPGSISNVECNFCICPDSGVTENRVCTKNKCSAFTKQPTKDNFACEPLAYFEVDCNICYCPRDGIKNVSKCTKNHCDKNYLRSDACAPGQLFSDECNVCVCPPDGNKAERACTDYSCADTAPWKKIFQLSESLLGNELSVDDATRNLDLCFPGEEFVIGCNLCVCPEVGLKMYATCSPSFCEEGTSFQDRKSEPEHAVYKKLDTRRETCVTVNDTMFLERQRCTPGSMYIVMCRQCICPYAGSIEHYCRELPEDFYCEQAYPKQNFLPVGRRHYERVENASDVISSPNLGNGTTAPAGIVAGTPLGTGSGVSGILNAPLLHEHTRYECHARGQVSDDCFRCECDGSAIIAQHCFRNTAKYCEGLKPSFLQDN